MIVVILAVESLYAFLGAGCGSCNFALVPIVTGCLYGLGLSAELFFADCAVYYLIIGAIYLAVSGLYAVLLYRSAGSVIGQCNNYAGLVGDLILALSVAEILVAYGALIVLDISLCLAG